MFIFLFFVLLVMVVALNNVFKNRFLLNLPQAKSRPEYSPNRREGGGTDILRPHSCLQLSHLGNLWLLPVAGCVRDRENHVSQQMVIKWNEGRSRCWWPHLTPSIEGWGNWGPKGKLTYSVLFWLRTGIRANIYISPIDSVCYSSST